MTAASEQLRSDHRQMETHLDGLLDALKHLGAERVGDVHRSFREIQRLAGRHMEEEERVFYPAVRSLAPDILCHMDRQHEDIRETERCLDDLFRSFPAPPSDRDLTELYRLGIEFHDAVQVHIVDEEEQLLKVVDPRLSPQQQERLLAAMKQMASGVAGSASA